MSNHPNKNCPMRLDTRSGDKVEYMDCNGYEYQLKAYDRLGLARGQHYTVIRIDVHSSSSYVFLEEFPDERFNTVCFCNVGAIETKEERIARLEAENAELRESILKVLPLLSTAAGKKS